MANNKYDEVESDFPLKACTPVALAGVLPSIRSLDAGATLFRQGDATFAIFELATGLITLRRQTPDGVPVPMHRVRPGEFFAEAALFSDHYHCDALALEASAVRVYPRLALIDRFRSHPEDLWKFTEEMARHVRALRTRLELRQIRSATERVVQALRLRADREGRWQLDSTLKVFGEELGLTHEALYRALASLEKQGRLVRAQCSLVLTGK